MAYVVERYIPGLSESELRDSLAELEAAAAELRRDGVDIRYLGSTFLPRDEACFSTFEASSPEAVAQANARTALPTARILEAVRLPARRHREEP